MLFATVFATVRGIVHDPQHRPIADAEIVLKAASSEFTQTTRTNADGEFHFDSIPVGKYIITVTKANFATQQEKLAVLSGTAPVVHVELRVAQQAQTVTVTTEAPPAQTESVTPTTLVSREEIADTPGAVRSNSLAMITNYVPGAYITHDQLHIRGGHQTSWLVDGVPVPNTNIASNVGPQFDPKDIDYLEVSRGGYGAEFGDRTYGVFNVITRSGFERNRQAELVLNAGNLYQTNDQFSLGSHNDRFAYYASVNGNRSSLGIETPVPQVAHDAANGYGGFGSFIVNIDPSNQLRLVTSLRRDFYQIPYDPNPYDIENGLVNGQLTGQYPSLNLRDTDRESDALVNFSWVHTFNSKLLLTVSPFLHDNRANYDSALTDPIVTTQHRDSIYGGGQASFSANTEKNDLQVGLFSFYQKNDELLGAMNNGNSNSFRDT